MNQASYDVLIRVTLSYYQQSLFTEKPELKERVKAVIDQYLRGRLPYNNAMILTKQLTADSVPMERLKTIMETSNEPLSVSRSPMDSWDPPNARKKTRPWTAYEDQRLLAGIFRHGIENWTSISKFVGNGRTRSQCSQRWYRGLDPKISKESWSQEEEKRLIRVIKQYGDKSWTRIASKMGNRSDVQCRYKYRQLEREKSHQNSRDELFESDEKDPSPEIPPQSLPHMHEMQQPVMHMNPVVNHIKLPSMDSVLNEYHETLPNGVSVYGTIAPPPSMKIPPAPIQFDPVPPAASYSVQTYDPIKTKQNIRVIQPTQQSPPQHATTSPTAFTKVTALPFPPKAPQLPHIDTPSSTPVNTTPSFNPRIYSVF